MTGLETVGQASAAVGLSVMGALHPKDETALPAGAGTLVLLGPDGAQWEAVFSRSPEAADGAPHPIDRWSRRVVAALAERFRASALFPFDGPPWLPVIRWAQDSGWAWPSPVGMLVHATAGLWFSCRGILVFDEKLALPDPPASSPCATCPTQPCRSACPVDAFGKGYYDVPKCASYLVEAGARTCMVRGCSVRHACPAGNRRRPLPDQAARHMRAFLAGNSSRPDAKTVDNSVDKSDSS